MPITVEYRKFCCCLPVRLGVFALSLFAMVGGSFVAAIGWMSVSQLQQNPVEITDEVALYIHAGIFTLLGLLGIFGFAGSLIRSQGLVYSFSVGLAVHLGLSIGSGVFTIYSIYKENTADSITTCLAGKTDADSIQACKTGMSIVKGVIVAIYVVAWLIELYAYFIVSRYVEQLEDEEIAKLTPIMPEPFNKEQMIYNGYPQRFSYSAYAESERQSYYDPRRYTQAEEQRGRRSRPYSEYAYALPKQAYGVTRGKDASNNA